MGEFMGFDPNTFSHFESSDTGKVFPNSIAKLSDLSISPFDEPLGEVGKEKQELENTNIKDTLETNSKDNFAETNFLDSLTTQSLGFNLSMGVMSLQKLAQDQIDHLNSAIPVVVFLPRYAKIFQEMLLKAGDLAGAEGALGEAKLKNQHKIEQGDTGTDISGLKTEGRSANAQTAMDEANNENVASANVQPKVANFTPNPWMEGTAYTAFLVNYWEMLSVLKQMKEVDGNIQIQGINMMVFLAKNTSDTIKDAAQTRFWKHIAMAIVDGVGAGVTVGATAISIGASFRMKAETKIQNEKGELVTDPKIKAYNKRVEAISAGAQAVSQSSGSAEKMANNVIEGSMELEASQYDALKEVLQAFRQVMQMQAERGQDAFKQNTDLITQMIQQIDAMRQKIAEAQAKALSRT